MGVKLSSSSIEELRGILAEEFGRPVTLQEAQSTGDWLLQFYGNLLRDGPVAVAVKVNGTIKEHTT